MNGKAENSTIPKIHVDFTETKFLVSIGSLFIARPELYVSRSTLQFFDIPVVFNAPRHGEQCSQGQINNNKNN